MSTAKFRNFASYAFNNDLLDMHTFGRSLMKTKEKRAAGMAP